MPRLTTLDKKLQAQKDAILASDDAKWMLGMDFILYYDACIGSGWVWWNDQYHLTYDAKKMPVAKSYILTRWANAVANARIKDRQEKLREALMDAIGLSVDIVEDDNYNDVAVLKVQ